VRPLQLTVTLALVAVLAGCGSDDSKQSATTTASAAANIAPGELHTIAGAKPPKLVVTHPADAVAPGYVFVAQKGGKSGTKGGTVIADNQGRIRWFHQLVNPVEATDFRAQTYQGKPVLTWWEGSVSKAGVGVGSYVVYDDTYTKIASVHAGDGLQGDLHEFQLTPRGTAFITVYHEVPADLTSVGGPKKGWVYDSVVQEIDISSGDVVFEWHSLDHVPLTESMQANREPAKNATKKRPLDYFHVNSISDAPNGNVLISGRNTSAIYLLARDGHVVWRLGGKKSDFGPPAAVKFAFQHNAQLHEGNLLSLFDNGAIPKVEPYTRPIVLKLDVPHKQATVVKSFLHPLRFSSPFEGNLQLLGDGGAFVGWGGVRKVTEFTPAGKVRFELKLPFGDSYRGFRLPWSGHPAGKPAIAIVGDRVYASWNGNTDVARWDVLAGADADHLSRIAGLPWSGLETMVQLETPPAAVAVRALDASGHTLGTSETITP
jgi:Arylsulfotransferase (ASST)